MQHHARIITAISACNLHEEQETLEQRLERSLDVYKSRSLEIQTTTTEASGARNLFSSLELNRLRAKFKEMITTSVPVSKPKVKEILQKEIPQVS